MMGCRYCDIAQGNIGVKKIYEDANIMAFFPERSSAPGHVTVMPKSHHTIFEQVPDHIVGSLFVIANKLSLVLVETLGFQGINLLLNNGVAAGQTIPHFFVNIIPRIENDGMNFGWQPKQMTPEQLSDFEDRLKAALVEPSVLKQEQSIPEKAIREPAKDVDEENYLVKALDRIP